MEMISESISFETNAGTTSPGSILQVLGCPDGVLNHPRMSAAEKRAVLASWASDAHAVPDVPSLRQLDDGCVVEVDEIFRALKTLDARDENALFKTGVQRCGRDRLPAGVD
jgi:hypothetical protein